MTWWLGGGGGGCHVGFSC